LALTIEDLEKLKSTTKKLMNHVHWVKQSFALVPNRDHHGVCINFVDRQEFRDEFCAELVNTISEWVYSQNKANNIITEFVGDDRSPMNAYAALNKMAFDKFRSVGESDLRLQGQFGELLLFNFLQTFFSAVPLIRKMPIATSAAMERFGADAIHYGTDGTKNLLYLGEAKTYSSKYKFKAAITDAIDSILNTYENHRKELKLYIYDDFIDESLINIAKEYKDGTLKNTEIHLVSIITYNETEAFGKSNEDEIKSAIISIIEKKCKKLEIKIFDKIDIDLHARFNYIIFPVWELDKLIAEFQKLIGK